MNPPTSEKYKIEWEQPDKDKLMEFMVEEHDFSQVRVENAVNRLVEAKKEGTQSRLGDWLKK